LVLDVERSFGRELSRDWLLLRRSIDIPLRTLLDLVCFEASLLPTRLDKFVLGRTFLIFWLAFSSVDLDLDCLAVTEDVVEVLSWLVNDADDLCLMALFLFLG